jgi:hypothetical protein
MVWQLTIDVNDPSLLAGFWAPALGYSRLISPNGHHGRTASLCSPDGQHHPTGRRLWGG